MFSGNIIVCLLVVPPQVASAIANEWLLGVPLCITLGVLYIGISLLRGLLLTAFVAAGSVMSSNTVGNQHFLHNQHLPVRCHY